MLEVRDIDCFYGKVQVLRGLSLEARAGEVLCPGQRQHLLFAARQGSGPLAQALAQAGEDIEHPVAGGTAPRSSATHRAQPAVEF